jgi:5'-nucleotidase
MNHRSVSMVFVLLAVVAGAPAAEVADPFHVLVANDDGIDAPGIRALTESLAADPSYRVTVVAPATGQSGKGHALTLKGLIRVEPRDPIAAAPAWAVEATPATTVRVGLSAILADDPPKLVVSGINRGENAGRIAWYSGTVGAAREAVLAGVPAIAFSLQLNWDDPQPDFAAAARWCKPVIDAARANPLPEGVFLNVNIPRETRAARGYRLARMGLAPDRVARYDLDREEDGVRWYRSRWAPPEEREPGADTRELDRGWVTLVPLGLDQTDYAAIPALRELEVAAAVAKSEGSQHRD